jgi:hypothetical protein
VAGHHGQVDVDSFVSDGVGRALMVRARTLTPTSGGLAMTDSPDLSPVTAVS